MEDWLDIFLCNPDAVWLFHKSVVNKRELLPRGICLAFFLRDARYDRKEKWPESHDRSDERVEMVFNGLDWF